MNTTSLMTAEGRAERLSLLQESTQHIYNLLTSDEISVEQGRLALDFLQLATDLIDLSDSVARRRQAKGV